MTSRAPVAQVATHVEAEVANRKAGDHPAAAGKAGVKFH